MVVVDSEPVRLAPLAPPAPLIFGVGAPRDTSKDIIERLNAEINTCLADPLIKARLADLAGPVLPGSPADFGRLIAEETERWGQVIKTIGIKLG
jgi:tripartite-type tricarboxylate transporter receptor subunit TctC